MIIDKLRLKDYGRFNYKDIDLKAGINIIYGGNESGKTTIKDFIKHMLCELSGVNCEDLYDKYKPFDEEQNYSGSMIFKAKDKTFNVENKFTREKKDSLYTEDITENEVKEGSYSITADSYNNVVAIDDIYTKSKTEITENLKKYLSNVCLSKDVGTDTSYAIRELQDKLENVKTNEIKERISDLKQHVINDDKEIAKLESLRLRKEELKKQLAKGHSKKEEESLKTLRDYSSDFANIKEMYIQYKELLDKRKLVEDIESKLQDDECNSYKKFPLIMISIAAVLVLADMLIFGTRVTGIIIMVCIIILAVISIILCNERVTEWIVTRDCEKKLAKEQYAADVHVKLDSDIASIQKEILRFARRIYPLRGLNDDEMLKLETEIDIMINKVEGYVEKEKREEEELKKEIEHVELLMDEVFAGNEERIKRAETLKKLQDSLLEEEKENGALTLALDTIKELSMEINKDFLKNLKILLSKYFKMFTVDEYFDIIIDDRYYLKVFDGKRYIKLEQLGDATVQQAILALRFAIADIVNTEDRLPILLDDVLLSFDDKRLSATLRALSAFDRQIIIFVSNKRGIDSMDSEFYNLIEL
ncbi:MAG: AAA family ATPase [Lachnospiraceae bacterium]|nr:AAA family ATPase [Lachnospiraceae bacterium]